MSSLAASPRHACGTSAAHEATAGPRGTWLPVHSPAAPPHAQDATSAAQRAETTSSPASAPFSVPPARGMTGPHLGWRRPFSVGDDRGNRSHRSDCIRRNATLAADSASLLTPTPSLTPAVQRQHGSAGSNVLGRPDRADAGSRECNAVALAAPQLHAAAASPHMLAPRSVPERAQDPVQGQHADSSGSVGLVLPTSHRAHGHAASSAQVRQSRRVSDLHSVQAMLRQLQTQLVAAHQDAVTPQRSIDP